MYVTYTRIYGWSDYGGESSYQPGYRLENMMWMTLLVYDYIIPGDKMGYNKVNYDIMSVSEQEKASLFQCERRMAIMIAAKQLQTPEVSIMI